MIGSLINLAADYMWIGVFIWIAGIAIVILLGYRHKRFELARGSESSDENVPCSQAYCGEINDRGLRQQSNLSDLTLSIKEKLESTQFLNFTKFEDDVCGKDVERPLSFLELVESTRLAKHADDIFAIAAQAAATASDEKIRKLQTRIFQLEIELSCSHLKKL